MKILLDGKDFTVFEKLPGLDSEKITAEDVFGTGTGEKLYCVHRLDKEVGGVTVYAKNEKAAAVLSKGFADRTITKTYLALTEGCPEPLKGELEDFLFHDRKTGKTYVVKKERKGVKKASLSYEVIRRDIVPEGFVKEEAPVLYSLVRVTLHTGRTHQIRVQFASRRLPLAGDKRYGAKTNLKEGIGLWSHELKMPRPDSGEALIFISEPPFL